MGVDKATTQGGEDGGKVGAAVGATLGLGAAIALGASTLDRATAALVAELFHEPPLLERMHKR